MTNFVAIRDWYSDKKAYCEEKYGNTVGILDWDPQNKTTSIMLMANGYGGYAEFKVGVDGTYIDSNTKKMYVDEQLLWSTFGEAIDPPVQVDLFSDTVAVAAFLALTIKAPAIISSTKKLINTYTASAFIAAENGLSKNLEQGINFTATTAKHMNDPNRFVPVQTLIDAIKNGVAKPDPRGSSATMYTINMFRKGVEYCLEVLYDKASNTIYHFEYYTKK